LDATSLSLAMLMLSIASALDELLRRFRLQRTRSFYAKRGTTCSSRGTSTW
jgi:hypothetical protein